jgi:hypothetical protein
LDTNPQWIFNIDSESGSLGIYFLGRGLRSAKSEASSIFSSLLTNQTLMCGTKVIKPCLRVKSNQVLNSREKQIQFAQLCYTHSQSSHKDPKSTTKAIQVIAWCTQNMHEKQCYAYIRLHQHEWDYSKLLEYNCINSPLSLLSGRTSSTSATSCAATTRHRAA